MAKDVKITPAAGKVEFQDSSTNYAYISGDPTAGAGKIFIGTEETGIQILDTQVDDSVFSVYGSEGTLFNVSDDLSDSLMSVNDAAGLPVFEAFADDRIIAGEYNQNDLVVSGNNVGIGVAEPDTKLHIGGKLKIATADTDAALTDFLVLDANGEVHKRTSGAKGAQGAQGPQGAKGQKGQTGGTGPTGSQGSKGQKGAQGGTGPTGSQGSK